MPARPTAARTRSRRVPACDRLEPRRLFAAVSAVAALPAVGTTFTNTQVSPLVRDASGNLYGVDPQGGPATYGSVFEVTPSTGTLTVLYTFDGSKGVGPTAVALDSAGNLFGVTQASGATGSGSTQVESGPGLLFELPAGNRAVATTLYTFGRFSTSADAGTFAQPSAVVVDPSGNLDVLASNGGANGGGAIVQFAPATGYATPTLLAPLATSRFTYSSELAVGADGTLYGTTPSSGADGSGPSSLYKLSPGASAVTPLATFDNTAIGSDPDGLYVDSAGNLFGTTQRGGGTDNFYGDVWEYAAATGTLSSVAGFHDLTAANGTVTSPAGIYPLGGVVPDASGDLIGTTSQGSDGGTVFSVAPATGTITTLATFTTSTGTTPETAVVPDGSGNFFGTTTAGGANGRGTVFELTPSSGTTPTPTPTPTPTGTATVTPTAGTSTVATSVVAGAKLKGTVAVTIANSGTATLKGATTVNLYAVAAGQAATAGTLVGTAKRGGTLAAGKSATVRVAVKPVALQADTYTLLAVVTDPAGGTSTATTGPTVTVAPATINLSATLAATPAPSRNPLILPSLTVTLTVTNGGNVNSTGKATIAVFLSTDGVEQTLPYVPVTKAVTIKPGKAVTLRLKVRSQALATAGTFTPLVTFTQGTATPATAVAGNVVTVG